MIVFAILALLSSAITIVGGPFLIGKPRTGKFTASAYLIALVQAAVMIALAGRILRWW